LTGVVVLQLNTVEPPHRTQVLLGVTWNAGKKIQS